jgi:hypothetical protein
MVDREKVVSVLVKRFPGAPLCDVAAAANAIVGLDTEFAPDCDCGTRVFSLRHVANGDVRVYFRVARPR